MSANADDFSARVRSLELESRSNSDKLVAHESICAERYKNINESIRAVRSDNKQTNTYLIGIGIMMLAALAKLVFFV